MIIQFSTKLTSESNSQNRGGACSNIYPEVSTAKPQGRQKFSYPILSDLLNYTLNFKFVNIAFSLRGLIRNDDFGNRVWHRLGGSELMAIPLG